MDQWSVVSEGRWDGVLVLTVRKGQQLELKQPSAVAQAKAFHLRPPRRDIVVLVDDQSEPP